MMMTQEEQFVLQALLPMAERPTDNLTPFDKEAARIIFRARLAFALVKEQPAEFLLENDMHA